MNHRIGTVDLPPRLGMQRYFGELGALELSATFSGPLKPSLITRWKADAPEGGLALAAPWVATHRKAPPNAKGWTADAGSGEFRDSPAVRAALETFGAICAELKPFAVVFTSPTLFSPSTSNRDKLRHFFSEVAPAERFAGAQRVWVPDGLWESLAAVRFSEELGITCAIDPLVTIPGTPPDLHYHYDSASLYFRILGIGRNRGLREDDHITLEEMATLYEDSSFIMATMERWKDAKNLKKRLLEAASEDEPTEVDPIARLTRRSPGQALAFQRPAGATADAAGALAGDGVDEDEDDGAELEDGDEDDADDELDETTDLDGDEDDVDDEDGDDDDDEDDADDEEEPKA
jgi:uncharacterized protein YecE (DUF72 family)